MSTRRYPKPPILAQLTPGKPAVIEASAGTGKTYTFEHLVVELLLNRGAKIENILVVTFTEKATAELTARVRQKLEALLGDFAPAPDALPDDECWIIDDDARARLRDALFGFDRANISTIHAFCQRVLTEHAFDNRRLFEQAQVEERGAFSAAFKDVLRRELAVADEQRQLLTAYLRWSGGVDDLDRLLHDCHASGAPLRPHYDRAALEDALERFAAFELNAVRAQQLDLPGGRYTVDRVVAFAELVDEWRQDRDLPNLLGGLDELERARKPNGLFAFVMGKFAAPGARPSAFQNVFVELDQLLLGLPTACAHRFLPSVQARLVERKRQEGLFDFQDMLALVDQSLAGPDGAALVEALRARYYYALIDEFQDTDDVQWRIFERLFFASGGANPLYVIGDPKQAIYSFRGADVQTYVQARERIRDAGGVIESLAENFRSTPALVDAYNRILAQDATPSFFSNPDIRYDHPVRAGRETLTLIDPAGAPAAPVVLFQLAPDAGGGELRIAEIRRRLGERISSEIQSLLAGSVRFGEAGAEAPLLARDIFILTRSTAEGYEIGRALRKAGVPHAFYKQDGLFQTDEAHHIRAVLSAIDDPHSQSRRYQAWITPFFGLQLDELAACEELPGTHLLIERLFRWKALAEHKDYEQLFTRIVEDSGLVRRARFASARMDEDDEGALLVDDRELTNYLHIFELLLEQVNRTRSTLRELVLTLSAFIERRAAPEGESGNVQRLESERASVQIMTLHKSKGLEAKVVFLYGGFARFGGNYNVKLYHDAAQRIAQVGRVCHKPIDDQVKRESREEDERLLYVGLTRAKARLYLPWFTPGAFKLQGCHLHLNRHLQRIVDERPFAPEIDALFEIRPLTALRLVAGDGAPGPTARPTRSPSAWRPAPALLDENDRAEEFTALRGRHKGFAVSSYSGMKRAQAVGYRTASLEGSDAVDAGEAQPAVRPQLTDDQLPGGAASGVFLHELLETLDFATLHEPTFDAFAERPDVRELFERARRRHDRDPKHLQHSLQLVHTALTAPLQLGERRLAGGLGRVASERREMEFLYPIPGHADGGFVKGYVDYLFEHEGLVYFADWKSDLLPAWDRAFITQHVDENYRLQAQLYSLALVKLLEVQSAEAYDARFGGLVYCFLRGMRSDGDGTEGVYFERPSWAQIGEWEAALRKS